MTAPDRPRDKLKKLRVQMIVSSSCLRHMTDADPELFERVGLMEKTQEVNARLIELADEIENVLSTGSTK